jgi:hypothetical protein
MGSLTVRVGAGGTGDNKTGRNAPCLGSVWADVGENTCDGNLAL